MEQWVVIAYFDDDDQRGAEVYGPWEYTAADNWASRLFDYVSWTRYEIVPLRSPREIYVGAGQHVTGNRGPDPWAWTRYEGAGQHVTGNRGPDPWGR